jgi:hypothetical protein
MVTRLVCCCCPQRKAGVFPSMNLGASSSKGESSIDAYTQLNDQTSPGGNNAPTYGAAANDSFAPRGMSPSIDKKVIRRQKKRRMDSAKIIAVACASLSPIARETLKAKVKQRYQTIQGKVKQVEGKKHLQDIAKGVLQGIILKKLDRLKTCEDHLVAPVTTPPDEKEKKRVWTTIDKMVNYNKETSPQKMPKHERLWLYLVQEIKQ